MSASRDLPTPPPPRMTRAEFRAWVEEQPRGRFELVDGEVVPMNAERLGHALVKSRVWAAMDAAVKRARLPCLVVPDGPVVEVGEQTDYEPDVTVHLGAKPALDQVVIPNPVIVVEVTSPSTRRADMSRKFDDYFRRTGVRHYLIVLIERRQVIHHRREEGGRLVSEILPETAELRLDPPGFSVAIADFFVDLDG